MDWIENGDKKFDIYRCFNIRKKHTIKILPLVNLMLVYSYQVAILEL